MKFTFYLTSCLLIYLFWAPLSAICDDSESSIFLSPPDCTLTLPLLKTPKTETILKFANMQMRKLYEIEKDPNGPFLPFCKETIKNFSILIKDNNHDIAALTLKFYIGVNLVFSHSSFVDDDFKWDAVTDNGLKIFQSIIKEFPNSWQAKFASTYSKKFLQSHPEKNYPKHLSEKIDRSLLISELRRAIPILDAIDQEPEFINFKNITDVKENYGIVYRLMIVYYELEMGHITIAEDELEKLKKIAPKLNVFSIETKIKKAKNDQN